MSGVSPTRPAALLIIPPVLVAAAVWPERSRATAPTVLPAHAPEPPRSRTASSAARAPGVISDSIGTSTKPRARAKRAAPSAA